MYNPKHFQAAELPELMAFVEKYSFGTLYSQTDGEPFATQLPFLLERDADGQLYLLGHMARVNPHWRLIADRVLVVFQGPHAYISPTWYQEERTVPTWNYATVHASGEFELVESGEELIRILNRTVEKYESSMEAPWRADMTSPFQTQLMQGIVGFKVKIIRFEGKWKLSQNHSDERRERVINALRLSERDNAQAVADLMEENLKRKKASDSESSQ
ncbi:FMN-binding negative transcriptional regulator [Paenibacillus silvisoli]|uniref:FMN-binding negative transcriptional regulator n=1 Tax=Paenibacillus silvisoli TaxID=3110539 RepID=UPI002806132B|nr:FMN-binding negative transcriptional regulator [Paenibacillus silvisoli]